MLTIAPLLIGIAFGFMLQKGGLTRYERIVGIFLFEDLTVLKFLLSALVTGAIGIQIVVALGWAEPLPVPMSYLTGNLLGGLVFGVGMALSGYCPGTVAAGAGEGRLDYLVPGVLGLYTGALVYGLLYPRIMPSLTRIASLGAVRLPEVMRAEPWLVLLLLLELTLLLFYAIRPASTARPS
jgi:uncharacterized membrane protein YedE/YeeE